LDASGNNKHGTIYGATWVDGKFGKALSFDGVDDYAKVEPFTVYGWSEITISEWVYAFKPKANTAYSKFSMIGDCWTDYPATYFGTDNLMDYTFVSAIWATRTPAGTGNNYRYVWTAWVNQWVHIVRRFTAGREYSFWINGEKKYSATVPVNEKTILEWNPDTATYPERYKRFVLGANVGFGELMQCLNDEVRIYNRAFDGGEVSFSNANPGLPPTRGLVAWYPMDEGTNVPFSFTAGSSYALTITAYSLDGSVATQTLTIRATG
jgi:hypothetical protein